MNKNHMKISMEQDEDEETRVRPESKFCKVRQCPRGAHISPTNEIKLTLFFNIEVLLCQDINTS